MHDIGGNVVEAAEEGSGAQDEGEEREEGEADGDDASYGVAGSLKVCFRLFVYLFLQR